MSSVERCNDCGINVFRNKQGPEVPLKLLPCFLVACFRLSVSGKDAKEKGTRKVDVVSSRFIFVFALSRFSGLQYLGARTGYQFSRDKSWGRSRNTGSLVDEVPQFVSRVISLTRYDDVVEVSTIWPKKISWVPLLHDRKRFTSSQTKYLFSYACRSKKSATNKYSEGNRTKEKVNGNWRSVWFIPTGIKKLPQNACAVLNFWLEFQRNDLTFSPLEV